MCGSCKKLKAIVASGTWIVLACLAVRASAEVNFARDVRPILASRCFKCHGPDDEQRQAGLRLDLRESAIGESDSGQITIVPGNAAESELLRRITSTDDSEVMPPPETKQSLTATQIEILKQWIAEGAKYEPHWAFQSPVQAPLPAVKDSGWPRNPIDHFVLARLDAAGLQPSPAADRRALIRRVSLDLIGLPPTVEEIEAFVNDTRADAYGKLVDRLLNSPHYGERWARAWLDLARYADTNGYEKDRPRSIWPYRDWVINALNADMPFDRFTIEQLAGDMLPGATIEQRIATGFHRNTMLNEEGGTDPLEFRFYAAVDRVNTTATTWLGLTVGCAQCHTHKYDPIPHVDYYRTMALLDNADEPQLEVPQAHLTERRKAIADEIQAIEVDLPNRFSSESDLDPESRQQAMESKFNAWLEEESRHAVHWTILKPIEAKANVPFLTILDDGSVLAGGDQSKRDMYDVSFNTNHSGITAIRLEVLPDDRLPAGGPGRVYYEGSPGDFLLTQLLVRANEQPLNLQTASHSFAKDSNTAAASIDDDPLSGWSIDGEQGRPHAAVFNLAEPLADSADLKMSLIFEHYFAAGLGRFRVSVTSDQGPIATRGLPAEIEALLVTPAEERTPADRNRLLRYYLSIAPELAAEHESIKKLRSQMPAYPTTLVMKERPADHPRTTKRHHRGEYLQPRETVEPDVLSILPRLPAGEPRNRLTFARWLVNGRNPLVGRVVMNRQWAALFGHGLVRTTADFGFQGDLPTHPELLDWLAVEFVRQGWSLKAMHRLMVTSATYQQASRVTPELLERDPENRLLARGPRFRLDAELIRDAALQASGLLSPKVGGPSVFPQQIPEITTEGAYGPLEWKVSDGEDRYRRGIYTFMKRTAPYAIFASFDAPSGEACIARREVSNTPLQSLTLLNNQVFVEAAQALGRFAAKMEGTKEQRITALFLRTLGRPPCDDELDQYIKFCDIQRQRLTLGELDAATLAGPGDGDLVERATWTLAARTLLNLDEMITRE